MDGFFVCRMKSRQSANLIILQAMDARVKGTHTPDADGGLDDSVWTAEVIAESMGNEPLQACVEPMESESKGVDEGCPLPVGTGGRCPPWSTISVQGALGRTASTARKGNKARRHEVSRSGVDRATDGAVVALSAAHVRNHWVLAVFYRGDDTPTDGEWTMYDLSRSKCIERGMCDPPMRRPGNTAVRTSVDCSFSLLLLRL
jgi:hypothetical protein